MELTTWIMFGLVAGVIAHFFDPYPEEGGLGGAMLLGVFGAVVGGIVAHLVFDQQGINGFNTASFIIAILGSLLLLGLRRAIEEI